MSAAELQQAEHPWQSRLHNSEGHHHSQEERVQKQADQAMESFPDLPALAVPGWNQNLKVVDFRH